MTPYSQQMIEIQLKELENEINDKDNIPNIKGIPFEDDKSSSWNKSSSNLS